MERMMIATEMHAQLPEIIESDPALLPNLVTTKGHTALHLAVFVMDEDLVFQILEVLDRTGNTAKLLDRTDLEGLTPLHMACKLALRPCVEALLARGANVHLVCKDMLGFVVSGFKLLPICGGKTPLHFAAQELESESLGICQLLLEHGADPKAKDWHGFSPFDLAVFKGNNQVARLLCPDAAIPTPTEAHLAKRRYERMCLETQAVWQVEETARKKHLTEALALVYKPLHPHLFAFSDSHIHPPLLSALRSDNPADAIRKLVSTQTETQQQIPNEAMLGHWISSDPELFVCRVFSESFVQSLMEEMTHFKEQAAILGLDVARPNSMNRYGVVLNHIGMRGVFDEITKTVVEPLVNALFGDAQGSEKALNMHSHHTFVVSYEMGGDRNLKTHADDSDFTVNLCLGKQFEGAELYFHHEMGCQRQRLLDDNAATQTQPPDEFQAPHPPGCQFCTVGYRHHVGVCVVHKGRLIHGVEPLSSGERHNLVIWCRNRKE